MLRDPGLSQPLSRARRLGPLSRSASENAFEFHPWVASVDRISKSLPASLDVELKYRRPVAAVESSDSDGVAFLPIDEHAIRLPEADLTDAERRYLPRISGVTGRPLVGDHWDDPRVVGGAKLAAALADVWQQLELVEILAVVEPQSASSEPQCSFEHRHHRRHADCLGRRPGQEVGAGESPFDQKRSRLLKYSAQHGRLESDRRPGAARCTQRPRRHAAHSAQQDRSEQGRANSNEMRRASAECQMTHPNR